jgi:anti-sigma factor RsiW
MRASDLDRLMTAALDGEATADESAALERALAGDPALRQRYDAWQRLFDALDRVPAPHPPEGLVAAVMANIPAAGVPADDQLPSPSPVFGVGSNPFSLGDTMSEQTSRSFNKRKLAIGVGLATIAAVVIAGYAFDIPPSSTDAVGTIAPAERFVKPQQTAVDVSERPPTQLGRPTLVAPAGDAASTAESKAKGSTQGGALSQTRDAAEGKPQGQTMSQTRDAAEGKPQGKPLAQTRDTAEGKPLGQALSQTRDAAEGKPQGQTMSQTRDAAEGKPQGHALSQTRDAAEGKPQGATLGQSLGQAKVSAEGRALGQAHGAALSQTQGQAHSQTAGTAHSQTAGQAHGQTEGQVKAQTAGTAKSQTEGKALGTAQ